eukprot:g30384.t1
MFGVLDTEEGGSKWAGVTPSAIAGEGSMGLCGLVGSEGRVGQGVLEGMVPVSGGQGRREEYVSSGSISLEVAEMAADYLLNVDAGGMVVKHKYPSPKHTFKVKQHFYQSAFAAHNVVSSTLGKRSIDWV